IGCPAEHDCPAGTYAFAVAGLAPGGTPVSALVRVGPATERSPLRRKLSAVCLEHGPGCTNQVLRPARAPIGFGSARRVASFGARVQSLAGPRKVPSLRHRIHLTAL